MKTNLGVLMLLAISMTLLLAGASSSLVSGQVANPCTATLSYPAIPVQYGSSNVPFVVPVSASCATSYGTQLYAAGNAYDATSNTGLGTASAILSSVNGGTEFTGQLGFNQFQASPGDSIQISVSIYSSPGGNLVTTTGETVQAGTVAQQPVQLGQQEATTTVTEDGSPYPTAYPPNYQPNQYWTQLQNHQQQFQGSSRVQTHHLSQAFAQRSNTNFSDWVAIITIIAAVIIATAALLLVATRRRQPTWYPLPPPTH